MMMMKPGAALTMGKIRWIRFLLLILVLQFSGCAAERAYRRAQDASKRGEWDRAVGEYIIAMNKNPGQGKYRAGFERARLAASQFHQQKAKQLTETKNYEQAIIELQIALNFDSTNQFISNELEKVRSDYEKQLNKEKLTAIELAKEDAKKKMQLYKVLGPEAETTIPSLRFHDDSLKHILDALGQLAGINIVYDSDFRDQEFSVSLDNIKFKDALEQIMVANHLYYKPLDQSTILIVPDNPQKRRQYDEQVIQTFYLSNAEINDVLNLIRSVMQIQRVATNPQLNAITLRDTPDKIAIAQRIIEANDKSRSEVLLDVEILEVDRLSAMRYGIDLSNYSVTQELLVNEEPGQIFGNQFGSIDAASWRFTVPAISYNALSSDTNTKVLAKPQIRASEGQQVTVRLGDRVPIPVTVFQSVVSGQPGGVLTPTTTFQLTDVGINIDVTPRVHHNREITLTLRFELTSIAVPGIGAQPPTLGNRTVNTVIRLKDGETNLLAGLVRRDERKSLRSIPGISKIPLIREIFASNDKTTEERDIIFTITPHILRTPKITPEDLSPIWIGTEDAVRLKVAPPLSVFDSSQLEKPIPPGSEAANVEEGTVTDATSGLASPQQVPTTNPQQESSSSPVAEPPAVVAPQEELQEDAEPQATVEPESPEATDTQTQSQVQPTPSPAAQPTPSVVPPVADKTPNQVPLQPPESTTISFLSPNVNPTVDTDVILHLRLEKAANVANGSFFLSFDPSAIQVKDILQGALMAPTGFSKSFDNSRGTITINSSRTPGGADNGIAATIILRGMKSGVTTMNLSSAVLRDANGKGIPVTYLPYSISIQ